MELSWYFFCDRRAGRAGSWECDRTERSHFQESQHASFDPLPRPRLPLDRRPHGLLGRSRLRRGTTAPASGKQTSDSAKSTDESATEPAKGGDTESSIGPQCTSYLACCDEIAESQPALAGSCDSTRKSVADATKKGASTDSLESSCKQALATMQSAGYCD